MTETDENGYKIAQKTGGLGTGRLVYVECDGCGEEALLADERENGRPWTRGHSCTNCGRRY